jgi:hypothetical protein
LDIGVRSSHGALMKPATISLLAGALLLLVSGYVLLEGGYITSTRDVVDIGGLTITAEERHPIRPWVAGIGALIGVVLIVGGVTRNR